MTADGPGFRLLAITPPDEAIDERRARALVHAWRAGLQRGAASAARSSSAPAASPAFPPAPVVLAVLLREPGASAHALVDDDGRLGPLRRTCYAEGLACLLSLPATAFEHPRPLHAALAVPGIVGVQLRGDPDPCALAAARRHLGPSHRLGRSCHGAPDPVPATLGLRLDYTVLAPIFAPQTGAAGKRAVGLDPLRAWALAQPHVFALGGITAARAPACVEAGAYGLAGIRSFFGPLASVADNVAALAAAVAVGPARDAPPS